MTGNVNHRLVSFEKKFMGALDGVNLFLFVLLIILASLQVSFRYLFFVPLPWTEELSRFFLVWVAFLGAASVTRRKMHILVDYLVSKMPLRVNRIIGKILYLLAIAFMASVLWGSIRMMEDNWPVHLGTIPWLSVSFLYLGAVIGSAIMLFYLILHLRREASFLSPELEAARPENAGQRGEVILTWLFLIVLLLLIFVGLPIAFSMGATTMIAVAFKRGIGDIPHTMMAQRMVYGVNSFPLLAIPFFLLVGRLMNIGGITDRIYTFCSVLIGHVRGGLAHVNILGSMIFAGMTGSAVSDAVGLGQMEIKAMTDQGYDRKFAAATTAASATIGPIIPPSIPMVLYGVLGNVSVGALFIGGIIPGVLMGLFMMAVVATIAKRRGFPLQKRATLGQIARSTYRAVLPLLSPVILIGGIWGGIFTPTEASVVAVLYSIFLGLIIYREMNFRGLLRMLKEALDDTSILLFIIAAASVYGWFIARYQISTSIVEQMLAISKDPLVFLLVVNLLLLVVGCIMESLAAINILTPILLPIAISLGIDPVHFGLVMVLNLMIGLITPPVGMVLYAVQRVAGISFEDLVKAVAIYYIPLLLVLLLITVYAPLVTWLPSTILTK
jgi:tripartite ATP-independent transporter DctM subunit